MAGNRNRHRLLNHLRALLGAAERAEDLEQAKIVTAMIEEATDASI